MLHQDIEKSVDYLIYYQTEKNEGAKANEWQLYKLYNMSMSIDTTDLK